MKSVALVAFVEHNKVLLQKRKSISRFGEQWGFFGGSIETGETKQEALIREIEEELSFNLDPARIKKVGEYILSNGPQKRKLHFYKYNFPGFENLNLNEGDNMQLFELEEALEILKDFPVFKKVFEDMKKIPQ